MQGISTNLRYLLWQHGIPKDRWVEQVESWAGCYPSRARALLEGDDVTSEEQTLLARAVGMTEEDLRFSTLLDEAEILQENIRYLIDTLPHGGQKDIAKALGVHATTVSRWYQVGMHPEQTKLDQLRDYFGLSRAIDLERDPVFLEPSPVGVPEQKRWIAERVEKLDSEDLAQLFPALKKMLGEQ